MIKGFGSRRFWVLVMNLVWLSINLAFGQSLIYRGTNAEGGVTIIDKGNQNHLRCVYQEDGMLYSYSPEVISGFLLVNGDEFLSRKVEVRGEETTYFLKLLYRDNSLKIFVLRDHGDYYFIENDEGELDLLSETSFRSQLEQFIPDCELAIERLSKMRLREGALLNLFSCQKNETFSFGVHVFSGNLELEERNKNIIENVGFYDISSLQFGFGFSTNYRVRESNMYLVSGLNLLYRNFERQWRVEGSAEGSVFLNIATIDFDGLSTEVPLGVRLAPRFQKFQTWLDLMLMNEFNFESGRVSTERYLDDELQDSEEDVLFPTYRTGFSFALGINYQINDSNQLELFYRHSFYGSGSGYLGTNGSRMGVGFVF